MKETIRASELTVLKEIEYYRLKMAVKADGKPNDNLAELMARSRDILSPST